MPVPRLAKISTDVCVFIQCPSCGHQNRIDGVPPTRVDLAMLRGSEDTIKCKQCYTDMDTMRAYVGEPVGEEIERREDPTY
jgi:hypothetical protein